MTKRFIEIKRGYAYSDRGVTVRLTKYFGAHFSRSPGSDNKMYLSAVVWYRRGKNRLGYLYPSIRCF